MNETISCISLHQPWASLVAAGVKSHETRGRAAPSRLIGRRIAIHAAKRPMRLNSDEIDRDLRRLCAETFGKRWWWPLGLARGAFVCTAILASSVPTELAAPATEDDLLGGDWTPGRFAWRMADVVVLDPPVPALGHQSWWSVPWEGGS